MYGLSGAHTLAMTNEGEVLMQVIDDEAEAGQLYGNEDSVRLYDPLQLLPGTDGLLRPP